MQFDIFTLCDYAQNVSGKLTIVGTFDRITAAGMPFKHSFALAVKISDLTGREDKHLKVSLRDEQERELVVPIDADLTATTESRSGSVAFVVNYDQIEFVSEGRYSVTVSIDGDSMVKYFSIVR